MTASSPRRGLGLLGWLLLILLLLAGGAGAAIWALSRNQDAARFFGVAQPPAAVASSPQAAFPAPVPATPATSAQADPARVAVLEARIARLENMTQQAAGSAGRADALLVAFAARRAIDRGVALGYLEPLLAERFGATHRQAVATVVTGSRTPVRLDQLAAEFDALAPRLSKGDPDEDLWQATKRELGSLVAIRRADRPSQRPSATAERAKQRLAAGQVDQALAEAMRLPGIGQANGWVARARLYIATHRALDEIESAALLLR